MLKVFSLNETETSPRVDLVRGHVEFSVIGKILSDKYNNQDFMESNYRYEYASFEAIESEAPVNDSEVDEEVSENHTDDVEGWAVILNRKPNSPGVEPVTILYFGDYAVQQS